MNTGKASCVVGNGRKTMQQLCLWLVSCRDKPQSLKVSTECRSFSCRAILIQSWFCFKKFNCHRKRIELLHIFWYRIMLTTIDFWSCSGHRKKTEHRSHHQRLEVGSRERAAANKIKPTQGSDMALPAIRHSELSFTSFSFTLGP